MKKTDFTKAVTGYFSEYLPSTCGLSANTSNSYRDMFKLLLLYLQQEKGIPANAVELKLLDMNLVSDYLNWLEESRNVSATTRNQRLAALKGFARYVQYRYPENMTNCVDIMNMRPKKHKKPLVAFLTEEQIKILFSQPDTSTLHGIRDLALMVLLYDSGARVQELADMTVADIRLQHPAIVILTGKGRKTRQVPLMKDTCKLMNQYITTFHAPKTPGETPLFFNHTGMPLTRFGITYILKKYALQVEPAIDPEMISPHVIRHTKAMHLLRAGVNMIYIRDFLGHVDITTTEIYARIDAEMKRKVFEETVPNYTPNTTMPWEEDDNLLLWLTKFGKNAF